MKKLVVALTAMAAFTGSASAADMAAAPLHQGARAGCIRAELDRLLHLRRRRRRLWRMPSTPGNHVAGPVRAVSTGQRQGGDGWFGTVGVGYDWQFAGHGTGWSACFARRSSSAAIKGIRLQLTRRLLAASTGYTGQLKND